MNKTRYSLNLLPVSLTKLIERGKSRLIFFSLHQTDDRPINGWLESVLDDRVASIKRSPLPTARWKVANLFMALSLLCSLTARISSIYSKAYCICFLSYYYSALVLALECTLFHHLLRTRRSTITQLTLIIMLSGCFAC